MSLEKLGDFYKSANNNITSGITGNGTSEPLGVDDNLYPVYNEKCLFSSTYSCQTGALSDDFTKYQRLRLRVGWHNNSTTTNEGDSYIEVSPDPTAGANVAAIWNVGNGTPGYICVGRINFPTTTSFNGTVGKLMQFDGNAGNTTWEGKLRPIKEVWGINKQLYKFFGLTSVGGSLQSNKTLGYRGDTATLTVTPSSDEWKCSAINITGAELTGNDFMFNNSNVSFIMYIVPPVVTNPRMSDSRVHEDSDEDGIVDFDEDERFPTSANKSDSDEDGIDDKVEIFSYTIKEHFVENLQCYNPGTNSFVQNDYHIGDYLDDENGTLCRYEIYADIDGDGNRAELDVDSDHLNNDGLPDGVEDLNHNGYVDNGETDPYNFSDDGAAVTEPVETVVWDAPSLVAIYAFEGINVGDNVTCNSGMHGYCQIASESPLQYYAVSLGTNSTFGGVFSKGGVQLRDNSHIVGDVSIYSLPTNSISPELGQNSSVTGTTDVRTVTEWPFAVSDNAHHSLENKDNWPDVTVNPGQTLVLDGDVAYRNLTVQAGATLKLGAGTIKVGNITLEWGSRLEFVNPGRETVLIVDGYVNWRAQIVNSDLQTVAKGFKLIQYAPGYIHIEGDWAGTIHARWSELTLGQVKKTAYGSFVAKKVYLGNGLVIYRVHFDPIPLTDLV